MSHTTPPHDSAQPIAFQKEKVLNIQGLELQGLGCAVKGSRLCWRARKIQHPPCSPSRRTISQTHAQDTRHWHHGARRLEENQPLPIQTLDFTSTHSGQTAEPLQFNTWHSPSRRSISQAPVEDAHHWYHSARKLEEHHSPCKRSISQAPTQNKQLSRQFLS